MSCHLPEVDYPTGTVNVELDEAGVPQYNIKENVAWDNIPFTKDLEHIASRTRAVCFGSLAQRNENSRNTILRFLEAMPQDEDTLKVFDINLRQKFYTKETIRESLRRCNILKINDEELETLTLLHDYPNASPTERCRAILEEYNLMILVLTCGVNGSYVFTPGHVSFQPTPNVEVADTVGAGDSFTAAFISSIIKGLPVEEAHKKAVKVSAFVCSRNGAMPTLPADLID